MKKEFPKSEALFLFFGYEFNDIVWRASDDLTSFSTVSRVMFFPFFNPSRVLFPIRIINNDRIETFRELINTMVSDYQKDELVDAVRDVRENLEKTLSDISGQIKKNTEAINAVSAAFAANTAANIAISRSNSGSSTG